MSQGSWKPAWIRGSKIEDIIWVGKDIIAWCTGVHIVFFNVVQRKQSLRWCWNQESGDGVCCLAGHITLRIFCFAEKVIHPRILVYSYPSMTRISECSGGCTTGYLATAFTVRDYLVSVGSYPNFPMIIWSWKTGEKLITINTSIRDEVGQILRITHIGPNIIAQMGKTCGRLFTWEFDVAGQIVVLKDHEVKLPGKLQILWIDWSPTSSEPLLAITDIDGHIFLSNYDGSNIYRAVLSQRCGVCVDYELPMVRWFRDGIILRTTYCQIRFFKKNHRTNRWQKSWYVKSMTRPCLLVAHPVHNDWFFYHTLEGHLMQIDFSEEEDNPVIRKYLDYGADYRFADFIYPWCHHLVVTDDLKELTILECYSGTVVMKHDPEIEGEISSQASHPDYPLVVLGTTEGELIFVSLINPLEPKVTACLRVQRRPLDLIKFSHSGRWLIAAEKKSGNSYCVSLSRGKCCIVKALIKYQRTIADVLIYEAVRKLKVLVLFSGAAPNSVGQQLALFIVPEGKTLITEVADILDLPGSYRTIWQVPGNPMVLIGTPYLSRQLRLQRVYDFKDVVVADGLMTGHYVRLANLFVDRNWITSSAFDGLAFIRDKTVRRVVAYTMTHHRADYGCVKVMASQSGELIVSLGYNGSLVALRSVQVDKKENTDTTDADDAKCIHHVGYGIYERRKSKIKADYAGLDLAIHDVLTQSKFVLPDPAEGDKTWAEWRDEMQLREEEEKCKEERAAIRQDFRVLQGKVKKLLDANDVAPEIEKLPVSSFDLDIAGRDQKLKAGRDECEDMTSKLEHSSSEMQRVTTWIRETFWDTQKILGKCLISIFGDRHVTNYASAPEDPQDKDHLQWMTFCREAVSKIMDRETFQPWKVYTKEELQEELNKRVKLHREEDRRIDLLLEEEEEVEVCEEDVKRELAMRGTTTHRYIEPSPCYTQMESYGFDHVMVNNCFLMHDCKKLRAYFNEAFDQVYELKEREMNVIRERIEKISYIDSELRTMFGQAVAYVPSDLQWHWQERPEGIIKVLDHEVKAKPYISPSQQEILDKEAAEAERIRLLLLADDFRERALMAMMDGVLEVRWEDVIKIDVPKPTCMLEKKPEDYNEEDIRAVKKYEKDVEFLKEERQRYNRMLEVDYIKMMELVDEGINRFNGKLDELFNLKINIESALNQNYLLYIRGRMRIYHRMKALRHEEEIKGQIVEKKQQEIVLHSHLQTFQNVLQELLSQHEHLMNREKTESRRFKSEFPFLSRLYVDLLERQYKRRPRIHLKNLTASGFLNLGSHVVSKTRPTYLPPECTDYLRVIDHLDVRPISLPPTIETFHWDHLVKLRRAKINMELRIRANETDIMHAEHVILEYEHRIDKCRSDAAQARRKLDEARKHQLDSDLDVELQLVLKMGQLEINLMGVMDDTENAVLVPKTEIDTVNEFIKAAGSCKLDALTRLLNFQRGTLLRQWTHECQRKHLEDLQEDLRFVDSVTVTKEMQAYLKRRAMGLKDDKTPQQLSEEVDVMKGRFEGIVEGHRARLRAIEKEIATMRSRNEQLDRQIFETNVARCEMEQRRDLIGESRQQEHVERKIRMFMRRSDLIKKLQDNYAELIELQTEHELLRLRRYPTFHFQTIDDSSEKKEPKVRKARSKHHFCPC